MMLIYLLMILPIKLTIIIIIIIIIIVSITLDRDWFSARLFVTYNNRRAITWVSNYNFDLSFVSYNSNNFKPGLALT